MTSPTKNITIDKDRLASEYGNYVSSLANRMIINQEIAKEAAQETWFEILKSLPSFSHKSKISTWIYTIAKRVILKYAVKEKVYSFDRIENYMNIPAKLIPDSNQFELLRETKAKCDECISAFCHCLNNESRLIFLFRNIAQLSYSEISHIMDMNESNCRKILSRSNQKIRNFLNRHCILFNQSGDCKCRITKQVERVQLDKMYGKMRKSQRLINFFKTTNKVIPKKNYWENYFKLSQL